MSAKIEILIDEPIGTINPNVHGQFIEHLGSCVYGGIWEEGEPGKPARLNPGVVEALQRLQIPVLRWPGGCFADDYHWRDGIGPVESRPQRINIWWDGALEPNTVGTHEFMALSRLLGAEPYLAGNVGSGTPGELRDWVEYCNYPGGTTLSNARRANGAEEPFNVRYWGVGNENWGCGGSFNPAEYAAAYRRFSTFLEPFDFNTSGGLFQIACGPVGGDSVQRSWTETFFATLKEGMSDDFLAQINGYSLHFYTSTDGSCGSATEFSDEQWYRLLAEALSIEPFITEQRTLMDQFDPERKIGLIVDEWGNWHHISDEEDAPSLCWRQNGVRDGLVAAMTLDVFQRHADTVVMANLAQTVNVIHSLLLVDGDRVVRTPTYHVFDLYRPHQGGQSLRLELDAPSVSFGNEEGAGAVPGLTGSASLKDKRLTLTVTNPHLTEAVEASIRLRGGTAAGLTETCLTHDDPRAYNSYDEPEVVTLSASRTLPANGGEISYTFAPHAITRLEVDLA
jgi:alpha-N-arabinofuranosidase